MRLLEVFPKWWMTISVIINLGYAALLVIGSELLDYSFDMTLFNIRRVTDKIIFVESIICSILDVIYLITGAFQGELVTAFVAILPNILAIICIWETKS